MRDLDESFKDLVSCRAPVSSLDRKDHQWALNWRWFPFVCWDTRYEGFHATTAILSDTYLPFEISVGLMIDNDTNCAHFSSSEAQADKWSHWFKLFSADRFKSSPLTFNTRLIFNNRRAELAREVERDSFWHIKEISFYLRRMILQNRIVLRRERIREANTVGAVDGKLILIRRCRSVNGRCTRRTEHVLDFRLALGLSPSRIRELLTINNSRLSRKLSEKFSTIKIMINEAAFRWPFTIFHDCTWVLNAPGEEVIVIVPLRVISLVLLSKHYRLRNFGAPTLLGRFGWALEIAIR